MNKLVVSALLGFAMITPVSLLAADAGNAPAADQATVVSCEDEAKNAGIKGKNEVDAYVKDCNAKRNAPKDDKKQ